MGIRTEKFQPTSTPTDPQFLTISRFVEKKGIEYALYAFAQCVDEYPELDYRLIGSGPRREKYECIIDRLGIGDNVTFLGSVDDEKLIRELDQARAFVLPCVVAKDGDRDGIPVAIMEAMAMETPVVTTNVSGIPELIDGKESGFLCFERSVEGLVRSIRVCLRDRKVADAMGKKARETVKSKHHTDVVGKSLESVFQRNLRTGQ
nr:glycosyltransferase [Halalkalicoccus sp. NIPERK01]